MSRQHRVSFYLPEEISFDEFVGINWANMKQIRKSARKKFRTGNMTFHRGRRPQELVIAGAKEGDVSIMEDILADRVKTFLNDPEFYQSTPDGVMPSNDVQERRKPSTDVMSNQTKPNARRAKSTPTHEEGEEEDNTWDLRTPIIPDTVKATPRRRREQSVEPTDSWDWHEDRLTNVRCWADVTPTVSPSGSPPPKKTEDDKLFMEDRSPPTTRSSSPALSTNSTQVSFSTVSSMSQSEQGSMASMQSYTAPAYVQSAYPTTTPQYGYQVPVMMMPSPVYGAYQQPQQPAMKQSYQPAQFGESPLSGPVAQQAYSNQTFAAPQYQQVYYVCAPTQMVNQFPQSNGYTVPMMQ